MSPRFSVFGDVCTLRGRREMRSFVVLVHHFDVQGGSAGQGTGNAPVNCHDFEGVPVFPVIVEFPEEGNFPGIRIYDKIVVTSFL